MADWDCVYNSCSGCNYTPREYFNLFDKDDLCGLIKFLAAHKVLVCHIKCPKCESIIAINKHAKFSCQKTHLSRNNDERVRCNVLFSAFNDTFFADRSIPHWKIIDLIYLYLNRNAPRMTFLANSLKLNQRTVNNWCNFIRDVMIVWAVNHGQRIGGEQKTVEIDRANITRKCSRSLIIEGACFLVGVERGNKARFFFVSVSDELPTTFDRIVEENTLTGTQIVYKFNREICVNEKKTSKSKKSGMSRSQYYDGYLAETMFMCTFPNERDRLHHFLLAVSDLYQGPAPHTVL